MLIYARLSTVNVCDWSAVRRLHDRKIFVLGLCTLLSISGGPQLLNEEAHRILPSLILVFKGLKRAYECKISRTLLQLMTLLSHQNLPWVTSGAVRIGPLHFLARHYKTCLVGL